jgi:Zn-dependent protease
MDRKELGHIILAYFFLSFALAAAIGRNVWFSAPFSAAAWIYFFKILLLSLPTLGTAIIVHELAHRTAARAYGIEATFKSWIFGLALTIIIATAFGIIFAIPGGVVIAGGTAVQMGVIALAGPMSNIALIPVFAVIKSMGFVAIGSLGMFLNGMLAVLNLIPIGPLDGRKVIAWSDRAWLLAFVISALAFYFTFGEIGALAGYI